MDLIQVREKYWIPSPESLQSIMDKRNYRRNTDITHVEKLATQRILADLHRRRREYWDHPEESWKQAFSEVWTDILMMLQIGEEAAEEELSKEMPDPTPKFVPPPKVLYLDFEYYDSKEPVLNLVSCSVKVDGTVHEFWLWDDQDAKDKLAQFLLAHKDYVFVSYAIGAEARSMMALGLNPAEWKWICLYLEFKQLKNKNNAYAYGTYFVDGKKLVSRPPQAGEIVALDEDGEVADPSKKKTENSLAACVACVLGIDIDTRHKKATVGRIIQGGPYSDEEREVIQRYNTSDLNHLEALLAIMPVQIMLMTGQTQDEWQKASDIRTVYSLNLAEMEQTGIPMDLARIDTLQRQAKGIEDLEKQNICDNFYPFFEKVKEKGEYKWVQRVEAFQQFVEKQEPGVKAAWPMTDGGKSGKKKYSSKKEVLEERDFLPEIQAFRRARDMCKQIQTFLGEGGKNSTQFLESIGSDKRLRCHFNQYGTQTGRNAPKSSVFVPAMSSWLRSVIRAPEGYAIVTGDYSSQEVLVGGLVTNDAKVIEAYASGDVYTAFGKDAKLIPEWGNKETHETERDFCKPCVLGMQFSIGREKLYLSLAAQARKLKMPEITRETAAGLQKCHRDTYKNYWQWVYATRFLYSLGVCPETGDGFFLGPDNERPTSVSNEPIQGGGSATLRRGVIRVKEGGLVILFTLHDAIYCICRIADIEKTEAILKEKMIQGFADVFPQYPVRVDVESYPCWKEYIPKKGKDARERFAKYIDTDLETVNRMFLETKDVTERFLVAAKEKAKWVVVNPKKKVKND